jgi:zinc protease
MYFISPVSYNWNDAFALRSLGELMSMKLVEKLREEKGGVYGVNAAGTLSKYPYSYSTFAITFPCAPENTDTLTKATLEELKTIISKGISEEDLVKVKEQQRRKLETDLRQNMYWISSLYDAYYLGNDPAKTVFREKQIDGLSGKMIQDAAKKYINLSGFIRGVLLPGKPAEKKPF